MEVAASGPDVDRCAFVAPTLELAHRQRGAAEDVKAYGYNNWPSENIVNNQACPLCSAMAFNLLSRAQRLTHPRRLLPHRHPKTIRHRLLHIAGHITPARRLHLDQDWPWTPTLFDGIHHARNLTTRHAA